MFSFFKSKKEYQDLDADTFKIEMKNEDAIILDVRTAQEFASGHYMGAKKSDFLSGEFIQGIEFLDPEKSYYIYCRSGSRSGAACKTLAKTGFSKVFNLKGGYSK